MRRILSTFYYRCVSVLMHKEVAAVVLGLVVWQLCEVQVLTERTLREIDNLSRVIREMRANSRKSDDARHAVTLDIEFPRKCFSGNCIDRLQRLVDGTLQILDQCLTLYWSILREFLVPFPHIRGSTYAGD